MLKCDLFLCKDVKKFKHIVSKPKTLQKETLTIKEISNNCRGAELIANKNRVIKQ